MLPELIGRARLVEGNSKLQAGTALAGATLVSFSNRRWGVGPTMVWGAMVAAVGGVGYAVLPPHPIVAIALLLMANLLMSGGTMLVYVNSMSVRQTLSPASLLGRVNGTMRTLSWGMQPLGALASGAGAGYADHAWAADVRRVATAAAVPDNEQVWPLVCPARKID